jgi:hypothetical protein
VGAECGDGWGARSYKCTQPAHYLRRLPCSSDEHLPTSFEQRASAYVADVDGPAGLRVLPYRITRIVPPSPHATCRRWVLPGVSKERLASNAMTKQPPSNRTGAVAETEAGEDFSRFIVKVRVIPAWLSAWRKFPVSCMGRHIDADGKLQEAGKRPCR